MSTPKDDLNLFREMLQNTGQHDQVLAAARDFATVVRAYHQALRDEGFNGIEALTLTVNFQQTTIQKSTPSQGS